MTPSERAAALWIAGGVVCTVVVQRCTDGEHSVSDGLRAHPIATSVLAAAFVCHLARRPQRLAWADPFHAITRLSGGQR
jgi:hypothetical protein